MSEKFEEKTNRNNEIEQIQQEVKPANKKVIAFNFILILVIFVGLFIYMVKVDGIENIKQLLHQVDYKWVMARISLFSDSLDL